MMRKSITHLEHMSPQELAIIVDAYYDLCGKLTEHRKEIPEDLWDNIHMEIEAFYE